jgi:hypothetical protein
VLSSVNDRIVWIRTIFRWDVANELVSETVYRALCTVAGLVLGHCKARKRPGWENDPCPAGWDEEEWDFEKGL